MCVHANELAKNGQKSEESVKYAIHKACHISLHCSQTVHNEITLIQQRDTSRVLHSVVFRVRYFYSSMQTLRSVRSSLD